MKSDLLYIFSNMEIRIVYLIQYLLFTYLDLIKFGTTRELDTFFACLSKI